MGELDYLCYENGGECVAEYKMDGLVTYKEEALCSRSEEGCGAGFLVLERVKREEMCLNMEEDLELCTRSSDQLCGGLVMQKMEEMGCGGALEERRLRKKRDMCLALTKRFDQLCGGRRKRAISEECAMTMELMESSDCASETEFLSKRAVACPEGWKGRRGICYKYFKDPATFEKASKTCAGALKDQSSGLATIESMIVETTEDRKFFNDLIESSGAVDQIDKVLSKMDDHFEGKNWKEVITYFDNWAWIGVKRTGDDKSWKWAVPKRKEEDWNQVKVGQADWRKGEPSHDNTFHMDNGNCVVYFHNKKKIDSALDADTEEVGEVTGWWNANCKIELPFLCEVQGS